jgi:hypothetical protein
VDFAFTEVEPSELGTFVMRGERSEFVPDPVSLERRVEAVTEAINQLRAKIQGRGVEPIGSPELASQINAAQEHWREVAAGLTATQLAAHGYDSSATIEAWERRTNAIAELAIAAGLADESILLTVTHTAQNANEAIEQAEHAIATGATFFVELLAGTIGLGALYYFLTRRRGAR